MRFLLCIISFCLVSITANLYFPTAEADVAGMDRFYLRRDLEFRNAVQYVLENRCEVSGKSIRC